MIKNKQGMSAVVTTLIIILLVIVALGIIWVVVKNVIDSGVEQVEWAEKCRPVEINLVSVNYLGDDNYTVTLHRTGTGDEIDGIKLVFSNSTDNGEVVEFDKAIPILRTLTSDPIINTKIANASQLEMTPYFEDDLDEAHLCNTVTKEF